MHMTILGLGWLLQIKFCGHLREGHLYEYKIHTPKELDPEVGTLEDLDKGGRVH